MEQKVALFEEYKTLTNRPWFVIDLEKTTVETLQVLVNKTKIKLGIPLSPVVPPPAPPSKHFGFAPEAFAQRFDPENASHFNQQTGKGGAANAGEQVAIRNINGGVKAKRLSYSEMQKLGALEPENTLSKRRAQELTLIRKGGKAFSNKYVGNNGDQANKNGGIQAARNLLTAEVKKAITEGKIILEENETQESIINNLLEEVIIDQESKIQNENKESKGNENILKRGMKEEPKWSPTRKSKFNNLFTKKFGHAPTNHIVSGIINQHNVHAGVQPKGARTRKNRKNKH